MTTRDASKLSVPIILCLSAIPTLLMVGISYGMQTSRMDAVQKEISIIQEKQRGIEEIRERLARVETKIDFLVAQQNTIQDNHNKNSP